MLARSAWWWGAALKFALVSVLVAGPPAARADADLGEHLRQRLEAMHDASAAIAGGRTLQSLDLLQALYADRGWRPIWFDDEGTPSALKAQLFAALDSAADHGLEPRHYHRDALAALVEMRSAGVDISVPGDIELLASDGLLSLGSHLLHGKVDPESIDPGWLLQREVPDLFEALADGRGEGPVDLVAVLDALAPRYEAYLRLRERLAMQRELAGNGPWPAIESGPLLRPGEVDPRVSMIRQRLLFLGDLPETDPAASAVSDVYDDGLVEAVQAFQRRHGLEVDGIVGPRTLAELNISPAERVGQLRANLERWRWLPRDMGDEYLLVNIAGYTLYVRAGGEIVMTQRVVVGTPARRTPVFTGRMTYLVLNPSWEVPPRLAVQDVLPRIRADEGYLDNMGFSVLQGWGSDERRIDPETVDWARLSARNFPYRLRQAPGPENALGQVKFMFPNRHNIYLHDTPARGLFGREERAFSSGCIRVEDADALTQWLLNQRSNIMSPERIRAVLDSGRETTVRLDRPLPVHLLYWTAWVDDQGGIHYRRDLYRRDLPLIAALHAAPVNTQGN